MSDWLQSIVARAKGEPEEEGASWLQSIVSSANAADGWEEEGIFLVRRDAAGNVLERKLKPMPGALPTAEAEALNPADDPGLLMPAARQAANAGAGYVYGLMERLTPDSVIPNGTYQLMQEGLLAERDAALAHDPSGLRAWALGTSPILGAVVGSVPTARVAAQMANAAAKLPTVAGRVALGGAAGGTEAFVQGLGETTGAPLGEQVLGTGLSTILGLAPGAASQMGGRVLWGKPPTVDLGIDLPVRPPGTPSGPLEAPPLPPLKEAPPPGSILEPPLPPLTEGRPLGPLENAVAAIRRLMETPQELIGASPGLLEELPAGDLSPRLSSLGGGTTAPASLLRERPAAALPLPAPSPLSALQPGPSPAWLEELPAGDLSPRLSALTGGGSARASLLRERPAGALLDTTASPLETAPFLPPLQPGVAPAMPFESGVPATLGRGALARMPMWDPLAPPLVEAPPLGALPGVRAVSPPLEAAPPLPALQPGVAPAMPFESGVPATPLRSYPPRVPAWGDRPPSLAEASRLAALPSDGPTGRLVEGATPPLTEAPALGNLLAPGTVEPRLRVGNNPRPLPPFGAPPNPALVEGPAPSVQPNAKPPLPPAPGKTAAAANSILEGEDGGLHIDHLPELGGTKLGFQVNFGRWSRNPNLKAEILNLVREHLPEFLEKRGPIDQWEPTEQDVALLAHQWGMGEKEVLELAERGFEPGREKRLLALVDATAKKKMFEASDLARQIKEAGMQGKTPTPEQVLGYQKAMGEWLLLTKHSVGKASDVARTLNSLKQVRAAMLSPDVRAREAVLRKIDLDDEGLRYLAQIDPSRPEDMTTFLRLYGKKPGAKLLWQSFYASILSAAKTHGTNVGAILVNTTAELAMRAANAASDALYVNAMRGAKALGARVEVPRREFYFREIMPAIAGLKNGIGEGWRKAIAILADGYDRADPDAGSKILGTKEGDYHVDPWQLLDSPVARFWGEVQSFPLRMLVAEDAMVKAINRSSHLHASAAKAAIRDVEAGRATDVAVQYEKYLREPTEEMLDESVVFGKKTTLNDEMSKFGKLMQGMATWDPVMPDSRLAGMNPLRLLLPFVKITDRIMAHMLEFTPAGYWKAGFLEGRQSSAARRDLNTRATLGTATILYASIKAMEGKIIGPEPKNSEERAEFYRVGKKPWSLWMKLPGSDQHQAFTFNQLDPVAAPFIVAAGMVGALKDSDRAQESWTKLAELYRGLTQKDPEVDFDAGDSLNSIATLGSELMIAAGQGIARSLLNKSYMSAIRDAFEAVDGAHGEDPQQVNRMLGRMFTGMLVPFSGALRGIAIAEDPRVKNPRNLKEFFFENLPGGREQVGSHLDPWGQEVIPATGRFRGFIPDFANWTDEQKDAIKDEYARLGKPLTFVEKSIGQRKLLHDEWLFYQRRAGQYTYEMFAEPLSDWNYWDPQVSDEVRLAMRDQVRQGARERARYDTMVMLQAKDGLLAAAKEGARVRAMVRRDMQSTLQDPQSSSAQIIAAKQAANRGMEEAMPKVAATLHAALEAGMSDDDIERMLTSQFFTKQQVRDLIEGRPIKLFD